jgi:hypothetical protein
MGLPGPLPPADAGGGRGPFGEKAFRGALLGCVLAVIGGGLMIVLGGDAARAVGVSLVVLGALGLATAALGLVAERLLQRRPRD